MFDIVRRRRYVESRVLIDSARILDSPFDDSLICLSGAELELLRNVCLYLRRQDTFVASYFQQHYLTPDRTDWDALQAVVAGLEEKLMGCEELEKAIVDLSLGVVKQVTNLGVQITAGDTGTEIHEWPAVPEGYIRTVDKIVAYSQNAGITGMRLQVSVNGKVTQVKRAGAVAAYELVTFEGPITLEYGNIYTSIILGAAEGHTLRLVSFQYDVVVPE